MTKDFGLLILSICMSTRWKRNHGSRKEIYERNGILYSFGL